MIERIRASIELELDRLARLRLGLVDRTEGDHHHGTDRPVARSTETRVRRLGQIVAALPEMDPEMLDPDRAGLGSEVTVFEPATGEEVLYTLLTGSSIELDEGEVSLGSPMGQALLGTIPGDEVSVHAPKRVRRLIVREVVTLASMLGLSEKGKLVVGG